MAPKNPNCESPEVLVKYKDKWEKIVHSCITKKPTKKQLTTLREKATQLLGEAYKSSNEIFPNKVLIFPTVIHCALAGHILNPEDFESKSIEEIETYVNRRTDRLINGKEPMNFQSIPNFQGRMNSEWFAYLDWFINENDPHQYLSENEINGIIARQKLLELFLFWAPFESCVMCVLPPKEIHIDSQGRWHNTKGWAFSFIDDRVGFVAIENILFPPYVVFDPSKITVKEIKQETNVEKRRILREQMGNDKYLRESNAKVIDVDTILVDKTKPKGYQIMRALIQDELSDKFLIANDGSTDRVYIMQVNPTVKTCVEAHESMCRHIPGFTDSSIGLNS